MNSDWQFLQTHFPELQEKLVEHISISMYAMMMAITIGLSLGIIISRLPKLKTLVLATTNLFQTIPSIALLAMLIPFVGIGVPPTLIALTVYALLPITGNTFTGLKSVDASHLQVASTLGLTAFQRLYLIELPLALPVIMAGIRTSMAMTIGITTLAAFIGAGGLGDFITQGLALNDSKLILLGAIPSALLALTIDYILAVVTQLLSPRQRLAMRFKFINIALVIIITGLLGGIILNQMLKLNNNHRQTIIIGSKNFTEQFILAHLMAELIEAQTSLRVIKKLNLGTTTVVHNAMLTNQVDLYPEYTGTAYLVVLKQKKVLPAKETYNFVKKSYLRKFNFRWLPPFGFENAGSLAVSQTLAKRYHLSNLSDLLPVAATLTLAAPAEFIKRRDGFPGLKCKYKLSLKKIIQMQPDLVYQAIHHHKVDIIEAFTTDARIEEYTLKILRDDRHFYPPYFAAAIIRNKIHQNHPEIETVLRPLFHSIDAQTMRSLNYQVDVLKKSPKRVAQDYLVKRGLIS